MIPRFFRLFRWLILVTLVGCTGLPSSPGSDFSGTAVPTKNPPMTTLTGSAEGAKPLIPTTTQATINPTQVAGEQFVRIWLPPDFDPEANSLANELLKARLDEFMAENPGVRLEVRVKALDGPGGMLDSLIAANAAAPSALPDLVLLSRPLLESATVKGLLYPYDGLTSIMEDGNWFEYARQLAQVKTKTYGIPFAGDIMVLVYALSSVKTAPPSLQAVLSQGGAVLFPAADPQALFTLCIYLAEGGKLQDMQGRPILEEATLTNVLSYYQQASISEVMPYTLTQYSYDQQVWEALLGGQSPIAVTWTSTYLRSSQDKRENLAIAPLPTPDGEPFSLATGWSWALAGQDAVRRSLSVKLAEFLVNKDFLAKWTWAAGYLPPRLDALEDWQAPDTFKDIVQIADTAKLLPSADLVSILGPALEQAVLDVIAGKSDAKSAAKSAIDQINRR